jgi:zinc transporter, ZIP family
VFVAASITALATGLGAVPFLFGRFTGARVLGICNAVAAGVMLGASASLLIEASKHGLVGLGVGLVFGVGFVVAARAVLGRFGTPDLGQLTGGDARRALLVVAIMTAHSVAEGVGVGAAFGGGDTLGVAITVAIAIHNIPEGVAVSLVMVPRGASVRSAALWSVFTSLPQPLLAVPAFLFVEQFRAVLPAALAFAAGAMIWMVVRELLPETFEQLATRRLALGYVGVAGTGMFAFQTLLLAS